MRLSEANLKTWNFGFIEFAWGQCKRLIPVMLTLKPSIIMWFRRDWMKSYNSETMCLSEMLLFEMGFLCLRCDSSPLWWWDSTKNPLLARETLFKLESNLNWCKSDSFQLCQAISTGFIHSAQIEMYTSSYPWSVVCSNLVSNWCRSFWWLKL